MRSTHTFAELEISSAAYDEIAAKLKGAGYDHAFIRLSDGVALDMQGIGLTRAKAVNVDESFGIQPRSARLAGE